MIEKENFFREEKIFFRDANSINIVACPDRDKRARLLIS